jgi:hypothetical protein
MSKLAPALVVLLACSGTEDKPVIESAPAATAVRAAAAALPVTATVAGDWRARVTADLAALRDTAPALLAELTSLAPQRTRAGHARFTSDALHDPRAASVLLDRLAAAHETEDTRVALAEALPRTGGVYADAVVDLLELERAAAVRAVLVSTARRAPADHALAILRRGFADGSNDVRAEACRTAASRADGAALADDVRGAFATGDATTRSEAARTLGILRIAAARDALLAALGDSSADVRLESLRALDRLAPGSLAPHPALGALARDSDERVARLASSLAARDVQ